MTKKKLRRSRTIHELAHAYATRMQVKAPKEWSKEEAGTYWWGVYDGYIAGVRHGRRHP